MDDALAADLESFRARYPFDDDAYNYVVNSSVEVQHELLRDFKPKQEGEADYSALIMGFTKKRRQSVKERQQNRFAPPMHQMNMYPMHQTSPYDSEQDVSLSDSELQAFRDRYPFDEDAYRYIVSSPPHVQREIVRTFKPPREGEEDYSALVMTFSKRCRNAVPSWDTAMVTGPSGAEYDAFRQRYPFDDDTHNYLQSSPPEVRRQVLHSFKPKQEGEADYSALLISFCKKLRQDQRAPGPTPGAHVSFGAGMPGMHGMPFEQFSTWSPTWHQPPQPPPPRPRSDRGCGGYGGGGGCGGCGGCGGGGGYGGYGGYGGGGYGGQGEEQALRMFRQRYPMDDRAFDFLVSAQPWVRQEVLEKFAPQRQDSDYSALIISFAKKCREREQSGGLEKRPRLGY